MSDLQDVLANAIPLTLDGKEWRFSKINLGMMADFEAAMAMRQLQRALEALGPEATHAEKASMIQQMRTVGSVADMSLVYSAEGLRLMLYLALKDNHPEVTEAQVGHMITPDKLQELTAFVDILSDSAALNDVADLSKNAETTGDSAGPPSPQPSSKNTNTPATTSEN